MLVNALRGRRTTGTGTALARVALGERTAGTGTALARVALGECTIGTGTALGTFALLRGIITGTGITWTGTCLQQYRLPSQTHALHLVCLSVYPAHTPTRQFTMLPALDVQNNPGTKQ
jgi:hypothetical protein